MQRFLTLAACLFAVGAVAMVHAPSLSELAALPRGSFGVVLGTIALAILVGEVSRLFKLPRLVGYTLIGLVAAPLHASVLGRAGADAVSVGRIFDVPFAASALLTGLAIGLATNLDSLRQHLRIVAAHTVLQTALPTAALAAALWGLMHGFLPVEANDLIPLIVAALLAAMASPTAVYAVNADLHAEGRFPELLLLVAIARNLAIAGALAALAIALGVNFDLANLHALDVIETHGTGVTLTLAAGIGAGLFLLGTLRYAADQVVIVALAMTAISAMLTPEHPVTLFVAGMLAGVIAANGTPYGFHLTDALDRSSPYFVSVIIVGAIMQAPLPAEAQVWAAAGVLAAIRVVAIYVGARLAGAATGLVAEGHFAYALFAQAFTALAVLGFADPGSELFALAFTYLPPLVVLDLIIGSLLQRIALVRSGVAADIVVRPQQPKVVQRRDGPNPTLGTRLDDERSLLPSPHLPDPDYRSEQLNRVVLRLRQRALRAQDALAQSFFDQRRDFVDHAVDDARDRLLSHAFDTFEKLRATPEPAARRALVRQRRTELDTELYELMQSFGPALEPGRLPETLANHVREMERACDVEIHVVAPEEDLTRVADPGEDALHRLRKQLHVLNTRFGPRPVRTVPVRAIAQQHLVSELAVHLGAGVHLDGRFRIFVWQRFTNIHQAIDDMLEQTLVHLDSEEEQAVDRSGPLPPAADLDAAAARESEELAAFDQRLRELAGPEASAPALPAPVQPLLADESSADAATDEVLDAWSQFVANLSVDFDDLEEDVLTFEADVRRRFVLALDPAYRGLLRDLALGGTYALPARRIEPHDQADVLRELAAEAGHWRALARAFVDRRAMLLAFRALEGRLRTRLDAFVGEVETELTSHLTYYPAEISERCDDVVAALRQTFDAAASNADLDDAFVQIRQNLSDFLQDEALASVHEMRESNVFGDMLRKFTDDVTRLIADQRDTFSVADEAFLDLPESASAMEFAPMEVPFQAVLERHFVQVTATFFNDLALRVQTVVDNVAAGLGQVNRVISFNLDAALTELRAEGADDSNRRVIAEFAIGGIQRAGEHAAELLDSVQADVEAIDHDIVEKTVEHLRAVRRYLFDESMGRIERLAFEAEHERAELERQGAEGLRRLSQAARTRLDAIAAPAVRAADAARERLMLDEADRDALVEDVGAAHFETPSMQALPIAYRRLFTPAPVETPELFIARGDAAERVGAALTRWEQGRRVSLVVTGDLGTGKTTFVHRVVNDIGSSARLVRWNIRDRVTDEESLITELSQACGVRKATSIKRFVAALHDIEGRRVIVVDGIAKLFLRTMQGRDALQTFLSLLAQSPPNVLWLVTCNAKLWAYLQTMTRAADYFTDHVELGALNREQLEALIIHRHRVSGFALLFAGDDDQPRLQRRYFDRLHTASRGHTLLALYYWAASVRADEEDGDLLHVDALRALRTDYLRHFDDDKLIGLAQLILHEELTEEAYAAVMRCDQEGARRDLAFFESFNLVIREPGRRFRYRVNEVLAPDVERALHDRNIV